MSKVHSNSSPLFPFLKIVHGYTHPLTPTHKTLFCLPDFHRLLKNVVNMQLLNVVHLLKIPQPLFPSPLSSSMPFSPIGHLKQNQRGRGGLARPGGEAAVHSVNKHSFSEHLLCAANWARDPVGKKASLICPTEPALGK